MKGGDDEGGVNVEVDGGRRERVVGMREDDVDEDDSGYDKGDVEEVFGWFGGGWVGECDGGDVVDWWFLFRVRGLGGVGRGKFRKRDVVV